MKKLILSVMLAAAGVFIADVAGAQTTPQKPAPAAAPQGKGKAAGKSGAKHAAAAKQGSTSGTQVSEGDNTGPQKISISEKGTAKEGSAKGAKTPASKTTDTKAATKPSDSNN